MAFSGFEEKWNALKKTREQQVAEALSYLECLQRLHFDSALGSGTYGDVVKVRNRTTGEKKAAKIVTMENFCPNEIDLWPQLNHRNIVPAEKIISSIANVNIILMPLYFSSWQGCLQETLFRQHPMAIACTKRWIFDLLKALDYLHSNSFSHLDLKLDNVLIDFDGSAVLCDFSALNNSSDIQGGHAALPRLYRPPEAFHNKSFSGQAFDLWACGALILQAFTGCAMNRIKKTESFEKDIYPVVDKIFRTKNFLACVSLAYPSFPVTKQWVQEVRQFIWRFMHFKPLMRVTPLDAMDDPCLFGAGEITPEILHIFGKEAGGGDGYKSEPLKLSIPEMEKEQSDVAKAAVHFAKSSRKDISNSKNIQEFVTEEGSSPDVQQPVNMPLPESKDEQSNLNKALKFTEPSRNDGSINISENVQDHMPEEDSPPSIQGHPEGQMENQPPNNGVKKKKKRSIRHWFQKKWRKVTNFFHSSRPYE